MPPRNQDGTLRIDEQAVLELTNYLQTLPETKKLTMIII
jgi:hypothetical protein